MEKKQIEIFPGVTVSESMALYVEHTKYENIPDSTKPIVIGSKDSHNWSKKLIETILGRHWEIHEEINPKLGYLGFSNEETDDLLRDVGGDAIIGAFDAAESLDLLYAHSFGYQERKVLFKALAYCTRNEYNQKNLPEVELDQVVLESNKFLPNRQIDLELDLRVGYTVHRN
jgi:hypothetical protein